MCVTAPRGRATHIHRHTTQRTTLLPSPKSMQQTCVPSKAHMSVAAGFGQHSRGWHTNVARTQPHTRHTASHPSVQAWHSHHSVRHAIPCVDCCGCLVTASHHPRRPVSITSTVEWTHDDTGDVQPFRDHHIHITQGLLNVFLPPLLKHPLIAPTKRHSSAGTPPFTSSSQKVSRQVD